PGPAAQQPTAGKDGWRLVGRIKGWMMVATVVVMSGAAYFVASMLAGVLRENKIAPTGVSELYLGAPWIVSVLSLPALAACLPLVRGTQQAIRWMTISTVLALIPLAFFLFGAVGCIAAIYSAAMGQ
ncbi:MAG: hypothetical protein RLZZ116_1862, partial [Planctomycetota bacterium]